MYRVRESWTDERLDDFRGEVNRRFDKVDKRFDKVEADVDRRFDKVDHELHRINDRLDSMGRQMIYAALTMTGSILVLAGAVLTHG
jgi:hypothetical protein